MFRYSASSHRARPLVRAARLAITCLSLALALAACTDRGGVTPLMQAAKTGDAEAVGRLLAEGADPDAQSEHGWTALMFAAMGGYEEPLTMLLDAGALSALESRRIAVATTAPTPATTALREALRNGHAPAARLLLERGAPPDAEATALAAGLPDLALLRHMHDLGGPIDVSVDALYTPSALAVAAREGRLENLAWLLEQGVDPDLGDGLALMSAVGADQPRAVELLIGRGAEVNRVYPRSGATVLLHAATKHTPPDRDERNLQVLEVLLDAGADPAYRSESPPYRYRGRTAVEYLREQRVKSVERIERNPFGEADQRAEQRLVNHRDAIIAILEKASAGAG